MVKIARLAALLVIVLAYGCASGLNPYDSKLNCPDPDFGVCTDVETAWKESFKPRQELKKEARIRAAKQNRKKCKNQDCSETSSDNATKPAQNGNEEINIYFASWLKETSKLLSQPQTPVIKPPKVLYGLIFPYDGSRGDVLFMSQRVFIIAEPPRFVLTPPWQYYKKKNNFDNPSPIPHKPKLTTQEKKNLQISKEEQPK